MIRNKLLLFYVFLIYSVLCFFQFLNFRNNLIGEEVVPFLDFVPKIISRIDHHGQNIYSTYFENMPPERFAGKLRDAGYIKTAVCYENNFNAYYWKLRSGFILPIMINEGSGNPFYHIHKALFGNNYNLNSIRLHIYIIGALILVIMWLFLKDFLNLETANIASLLLGTSLPFLCHLTWLRFPDSYIFLLQLIIILLFWKFHSTRMTGYFYAVFFSGRDRSVYKTYGPLDAFCIIDFILPI